MADRAALIEPCIPALRRFARALTGDADLADDLVQDCLERALSRWALRRADGDPRAWLFRILHNLFLSARRTEARRGAHVGLDESGADAGVPGGQEAAADLGAALALVAALPADQRAVLLLVGVEGFTYAQTARMLQVPVGTIMSRLSRARARLRAGPGQGRTGLRSVK